MKTIVITISGKRYLASLNENKTVDDLWQLLPFKITLQRYAGHEFFSRLAKKPAIKEVETTSKAHAGGLYYFDGWGAFTIVYGDADVSPHQGVHLGDVQDDIVSMMATATEPTLSANSEKEINESQKRPTRFAHRILVFTFFARWNKWWWLLQYSPTKK